MGVTRIKIKASVGDKKVTVPLGQIFDEAGREKLIETICSDINLSWSRRCDTFK